MWRERWRPEAICLYRRPVRRRNQIDGLVALVHSEMGRHAADRSLYVFVNRGRDKVKLLIWQRNGYWLLYKRVERQRFTWPDWFDSATLTRSEEQLDYLLDGYNLNGMRPHTLGDGRFPLRPIGSEARTRALYTSRPMAGPLTTLPDDPAVIKALPPDLPRVEVFHDLAPQHKQCSCGQSVERSGEQVLEQLAVIPQQHSVIRHVRPTYACASKQCIRTASIPTQPQRGGLASNALLAQVMVNKYLDWPTLYRQEKMDGREGSDLPRAKLARWLVQGSAVLQPLVNLPGDTFFSYDIAHSDNTRIQVLKEEAGRQRTKCLVNPPRRASGPAGGTGRLCPSKSGEPASRLLS